jgi:acyl-CoA thioesterase
VDIELDGRWSIGGKPHGGYLLRTAVAPLLTEDHPHPLTVSAIFLRSPDPGPASVVTSTLRTGRSVSQHRTSVVQHDATVLEALVTTGTLATDAPFWSAGDVPDLPPVEDCPRNDPEPFPGFRIGHLEFVEVRRDPAAFGVPPDEHPGELHCWVRMVDAPATALDLVLLADALPPIPLAMGLPGWVPTLELTVYVRGVPAPGWLRARHRTRLMAGGYLEEDCDLWDSSGALVVQARQLAGIRPPA